MEPIVHKSPSLEWIEKQLQEGVVVEFTHEFIRKRGIYRMVFLDKISMTKSEFQGPSLLATIREAYEADQARMFETARKMLNHPDFQDV